MRTHGGDVEKVLAEIGSLTLTWLKRNGIEYDEIVFGKPFAHVYIDDLAIPHTSWLETSQVLTRLGQA
jgi:hypothetical protein